MSNSFNNRGTVNITNSAMAFGDHAKASTEGNSAALMSQEEAALRADLEELLSRLQRVSGELTAPAQGEVARAIDEVAQELESPRPRWQRVQTALGRVTPAVATLAKLAADVAHIADAITPLIPH